MTAPIDTARVLIVPDLSHFAGETEAGIDTAFREVEGTVDDVIATMERQFTELSDRLVAQFEEIAAAATSSFDDMASASIASSDVMSEGFVEMAARVDAAFEEMKLSADRDLGQMQVKGAETSGRLSGMLGSLGGVAAGATAAVTAALGGVAFFGLTSAANLEQVKISFESLTGSVAAGDAQFKQLQQFAAATPFEFSDLTTAAKRFDAFSASVGMSQSQLVPFLTTIGNLVSETGGGAQSLDSISLALGQTASQGKITLGNLNQINNAIPGFNSVAAIAAQRGESTAAAMKEISAGSISASEGIPQLLAGMKQFPGAADAMTKQSQTLLGVFSTFKDTVAQTLAGAFAPVIPLIKDSLTQITPIIGDALGQLGPALGKLVANVLPLIGNLLTALVPMLTPILNALSDAAQIIGPVLGPLGAAIGLLFKALEPLIPVLSQVVNQVVTALIPVIADLAPVLVQLVDPLVDILVALMPLIPPLGQLLVAVVALILPLVDLISILAEFLASKALVPVVAALAFGIKAVAAAVQFLATWIDKINWKAVGSAIAGAWDDVVGFFENLPGEVLGFLASLPGRLGDLAGLAFDTFFKAVGFWLALIIHELVVFPDQVVAIFIALNNWVTKIVGRLWSEAKHLFMEGIDALVGFLEKLPGRVESWLAKLPGVVLAAVKDAGHWLYDAGKNMLLGLLHGIEDTLGYAINAVKRSMHDVISGAESALGIHSPSKVFMEIGHQVVAGFVGGVDDKRPTAGAAVGRLVGATTTTGHGGAGTGHGGATFGPGAIVVHFNGTPSAGEAYTVGAAVGRGIADTLTALAVNNAVRTM